jgi:hypothetical protein
LHLCKIQEQKIIFLILYVYDILLASSHVSLLLETKRFLSSNFDMKDLGEASFVLGIEIHRDRRKGILRLSQKAYLEKVLKKFSMHACNPMPTPIVKGDKYRSFQSPRNQYEIDQMKSVPDASAVRSLMYAQVCTHPDLAFVTAMLDRYQKNPGIDHWNGIKKDLRYIQGTKGFMLNYKRSDSLKIVGYSDSNFVDCLDTDRFTSAYVFKLAGGTIS